MSKKNGDTSKSTTTKQSRFNDTSAHAQRQRLLKFLIEAGSVTTVYARDSLGIMSPAPRVLELRERGYNINTEHVDSTDSLGCITTALHVMFCYPTE